VKILVHASLDRLERIDDHNAHQFHLAEQVRRMQAGCGAGSHEPDSRALKRLPLVGQQWDFPEHYCEPSRVADHDVEAVAPQPVDEPDGLVGAAAKSQNHYSHGASSRLVRSMKATVKNR
jgi:hypothetical protein